MKKINKNELVELVAEKEHLSKKETKAVLDRAFSLMRASLLSGKEVVITNFGTFSPMVKKSREGTDPKSHQRITIQETKTVSFKLAKSLKEEFNK